MIDRSLRDLLEAGRGSTVLTRGRASYEGALAVLRTDHHATLLEVSATRPPATITALFAAAVEDLAPRAFLWRHAEIISHLRGGNGDHGENGAALAKLLQEIATVRPLLILVTDLEAVGRETLELLRPLAIASARDPAATSFVVMLHTAETRDTPALAALAADLRSLPGFVWGEALDLPTAPTPPSPITNDREHQALVAVAIALAPVTAELVAVIAAAELAGTERALASLLGKGLVHMDSDDGRPRYRAADLAQAAGHLSAVTPAERISWHARAATALAGTGDLANANAQLDAMLSIAQTPTERADAFLLRAEILARARPAEARAALDELSALGLRHHGSTRLRAEIADARSRLAVGARAALSPLLNLARRTLAKSVDTSPEYAMLRRAIANLELDFAWTTLEAGPTTLATFQRQTRVARELPEARPELRLLEGELELAHGRIGAAEERFGEARDLAGSDGNRSILTLALVRLAATSLDTGRGDPAALAADATRAASSGEASLAAAARVAEARAAIAHGNFGPAQAALAAVAKGHAGAGRTPTQRELGTFELATAEIALAIGDPADAARAAKTLLDASAARGDVSLELEARALLVRALLAAGELTRARSQARAALGRARKLEHAHGIGRCQAAFLAIAVAESDDPGAARHAALALAAFHQAGSAKAESAVLATASAIQLRQPQLKLPPGLTRRLRAGGDGASLWRNDPAIDRKSLELLAAALTEPADVARALLRLSQAARAPWVMVVHAGEVMARRGDPPEEIVRRALALPIPPPRRVALAGRRVAVYDVQPWSIAGNPPYLLVPVTAGAAPAGVVNALVATLARALLASTSLSDVSALGQGFGRMLGQSPPMLRLFALLERIATNELPVLLQGESGTGKELAARAIHDASPRRQGPFVPIDCAAIPESLIESELFGHKKGAFTGTVDDRKGLLEEAAGGTVFLDEIANIATPVQAKLLRVLQERKVRRVGDTALRPIDVRLISAANRPLEESVRDGAFREDLFFRVNVIEVRLPPLRERKADIPLLIESFLSRIATPPPRLQHEAMARLQAYDWPGNVRELENEIRRASVIARATVITAQDLSPRIAAGAAAGGERPLTKLKDAVTAVERDLVKRALAEAQGHRGRAARLLGLSHQGLLNKIRKYGLLSPPGEPRST